MTLLETIFFFINSQVIPQEIGPVVYPEARLGIYPRIPLGGGSPGTLPMVFQGISTRIYLRIPLGNSAGIPPGIPSLTSPENSKGNTPGMSLETHSEVLSAIPQGSRSSGAPLRISLMIPLGLGSMYFSSEVLLEFFWALAIISLVGKKGILESHHCLFGDCGYLCGTQERFVANDNSILLM